MSLEYLCFVLFVFFKKKANCKFALNHIFQLGIANHIGVINSYSDDVLCLLEVALILAATFTFSYIVGFFINHI